MCEFYYVCFVIFDVFQPFDFSPGEIGQFIVESYLALSSLFLPLSPVVHSARCSVAVSRVRMMALSWFKYLF